MNDIIINKHTIKINHDTLYHNSILYKYFCKVTIACLNYTEWSTVP